MSSKILLPLRAAQGVFAVVLIGLSGYVIHWYNADTLTASPPQFNFLLFAPIFSIFSIIYMEISSRFLKKFSHPYGHLALEAVNMIFFFAGFIALAAFLGKLLFCRGSVCNAARADVAFAALAWVLWAASTVLVALELFKGGFKGVKTDKEAKAAMKEAPSPA